MLVHIVTCVTYKCGRGGCGFAIDRSADFLRQFRTFCNADRRAIDKFIPIHKEHIQGVNHLYSCEHDKPHLPSRLRFSTDHSAINSSILRPRFRIFGKPEIWHDLRNFVRNHMKKNYIFQNYTSQNLYKIIFYHHLRLRNVMIIYIHYYLNNKFEIYILC